MIYEDQARTFGSCAEAVRWADAFLLDPHVVSQVETIRRRKVEQQTKRGPTLNELSDVAQTISIELERIPWAAGPLFRYVNGQRKYRIELADFIAHLAWNGPGTGSMAKRKTFAQCRNLAELVLNDTRQRDQFGKKPASIAAMAANLGITREQLRDLWVEELSAMRSDIKRLLVKAEYELDPVLRRIGILV